ncbi:MAG TPA: succinate--CoA ligase subunit alpha [Candidatus Saccharimonadales bacterium]
MISPGLFTPKNVIVQGITGTHGAFHTETMLASGTNIVAGTSPNKAGSFVHRVPVYKTILDIQADFTVDASVIFVPAPFAKNAIFEAIEASVPLIVCITEGIPIHDMLEVKQKLAQSDSILLGPNCPGVITPGKGKLGIIPANLSLPGNVGIVSRSGTLTYEAMASLSRLGIGQQYVIGIGGDPVRGLDFVECLELFSGDPNVERIIMIGEIGGKSEIEAAAYISSSMSKPVFGYIAGHQAPRGVQLGHAGAILGSNEESAQAKTTILQDAGVSMFSSLPDLIKDFKIY